jgi:hypothetical protein
MSTRSRKVFARIFLIAALIHLCLAAKLIASNTPWRSQVEPVLLVAGVGIALWALGVHLIRDSSTRVPSVEARGPDDPLA